jgi:26S proteasome regulatory subunit N8
LRELKDMSVDSLGEHIGEKKRSIDILAVKLKGIAEYLQKLVTQKLPINSKLLFVLQDILNLLPSLNSQ